MINPMSDFQEKTPPIFKITKQILEPLEYYHLMVERAVKSLQASGYTLQVIAKECGCNYNSLYYILQAKHKAYSNTSFHLNLVKTFNRVFYETPLLLEHLFSQDVVNNPLNKGSLEQVEKIPRSYVLK
jgi:hypothetical protein